MYNFLNVLLHVQYGYLQEINEQEIHEFRYFF